MPDLETRQLDELTIDQEIDPRLKQRSQERIEGYADNIDGLPPILVDGNNRILDGIHRYHAHRLMGRDRIEVQVVEPDSQLDALTHAIKANAIHGLGLSSEELKRDAIRLWESGATEEHIANTISRSVGTVQSYLAEAKQRLIDKQKREVVNLCKDGHGQKQISKIISENSRRTINQKTVSNYLKEHRKEQVGVLHEQGLTKQEIKNKLKEAFPRNTSDPVGEWIEEYIASRREPEPDQESAIIEAHEVAESEDDIDYNISDGESKRTHKEMQWMLLWLGNELNLNLWLPKTDFTQSHKKNEIANLSGMLNDLPFDILTAGRSVERIDVLWLKDNKIIAAFEIVHSTSVESGLLRMSHMWVSLEDSGIRAHIVAHRNKLHNAREEIIEPTFTHIGLAKSCWFIAYTELTKKYNEAEQNGSIPYDWQRLLDAIGYKL